MWAQLIKARMKPGREEDARRLAQDFESHVRASGIGPTRVVQFSNQNDPQELYTIAFFDSEAKARESESHPEQSVLITKIWDEYEGAEYADLNPVLDWSR